MERTKNGVFRTQREALGVLAICLCAWGIIITTVILVVQS